MMNNKMSITNYDTSTNIVIGLFSVLMFAGITCFWVFAYLSVLKVKNYLKNDLRINILMM